MLIVCVFLIVCSAAFSAKDTVEIFGANIYIVQAEGFDKAPEGSVVLVQKTTAYELDEGKLVLYTANAESTQCALGYVENIYVVDGQYYLTVTDGTTSLEISEHRLVGRADYSSVFLGSVLTFIKTPFGIFCVAVLPCIALVLYDVIRAAARRLPDPEVEPLYKNSTDTGNLDKAVANRRSISVNSDGRASYSKKKPENATMGDDVLFTYEKRKNPVSRPIISLNDKPVGSAAKTDKPSVGERSDESAKPTLTANSPQKPVTPENIAIGRYAAAADIGKAKSDAEEVRQAPQIPKRDNSDAFFAQTTTSAISGGIPKPNNAPQIGRQVLKRSRTESDSDNYSDIDSDANSDKKSELSHTTRTAGKRSSQILASKRVEDLIDDDDDIRSRRRMTNTMVDDIMSGIRKKDDEE